MALLQVRISRLSLRVCVSMDAFTTGFVIYCLDKPDVQLYTIPL